MNPLGCRIVRPVSLAIFIGLVSTRPAFCNSYPLINVDPSAEMGPNQYPGSFDEAHGDGMIGWTFHLEQSVTITQIGWYDQGADGLSRAFQVGLWQDLTGGYFSSPDSTQLLGDPNSGITIPAGTSASLNGVWRVIDLPDPLNLPPGDYEISGLDTATTPDVIRYLIARPSSNPQVTIRQFFYPYFLTQPGFRLTYNSDFYLLDGGLELGPMLFSNVPEPSGLALGSLSTLALLLFHRRK